MNEKYEIFNAEITNARWGHQPQLTHWIDLEGDGWGVGFGGYALIGPAAFEWIENICKTLDCEFNEFELIGKVVRVKSTGWGGKAIAIGHPIKDDWFEPDEYFKKYTFNDLPARA